MKRSRAVTTKLLPIAAAMLLGCSDDEAPQLEPAPPPTEKPGEQRLCVDQNNQVVSQDNCTQRAYTRDSSGGGDSTPWFFWYFMGTQMGSNRGVTNNYYSPGTTVTGGRREAPAPYVYHYPPPVSGGAVDAPRAGAPAPAYNPNVSRGGFGSSFSSHGGGFGAGA